MTTTSGGIGMVPGFGGNKSPNKGFGGKPVKGGKQIMNGKPQNEVTPNCLKPIKGGKNTAK